MKKLYIITTLVIIAMFAAGYHQQTGGVIRRVAPGAITQFSCTDSDNGYNYYVAGHITGIEERRGAYEYYDTCLSGNRLKEFACSQGRPVFDQYRCPNAESCVSGRCE